MGWFTSKKASQSADCGCCENSGCCDFPCNNENYALAYVYWGINPQHNDEYNVYGEILTYKSTNDYCSWVESGENYNAMSDWTFYNLTKSLGPYSGVFYCRYNSPDGISYELDLCLDPARTDPLLTATGLVGIPTASLKTRTELYYLNISGTVDVVHASIPYPGNYDFTISGVPCDSGDCSVFFDGDYNDTGVLQNGYPIYFQYRDNAQNNNSAYVKIWYQSGTPLAEEKLPQWLDAVLPNFKYAGAELIGTGAIEELKCECFGDLRYLRNRYTLVTPAGSGNAANHAFVCLKYYHGSGLESGIAITGYDNSGTGNCNQNDIREFLGANCNCITTPLISGDWHATKILTIGDGTPDFMCPDDDRIAIDFPQPITFITGNFIFEPGDAGYSSFGYFQPTYLQSYFTDWDVFRKCMDYNFLEVPKTSNFLSKANCCPPYFSAYGYECPPVEECYHDNNIIRHCALCNTANVGGTGNKYAQVIIQGFQNQISCNGDLAGDLNGTWIFDDFAGVTFNEGSNTTCTHPSGHISNVCVGYKTIQSDGMYFTGDTKIPINFNGVWRYDENCQNKKMCTLTADYLNAGTYGNECGALSNGGNWDFDVCINNAGCNKYILLNGFATGGPCSKVLINKKRVCLKLLLRGQCLGDSVDRDGIFRLDIFIPKMVNDRAGPVINSGWYNPNYDYSFPLLYTEGMSPFCGQPIRCNDDIEDFYNGYCTQYSNSDNALMYYRDFAKFSSIYSFFGNLNAVSGIELSGCVLSTGVIGTGELMYHNDFLCYENGEWTDYRSPWGTQTLSLFGTPGNGYLSPASTTGILPTIEVTFNE